MWPPWGTAPAARPVRAPWTVIGTCSAWSFRRMARTSSSVVGNEILDASPDVRDSSRPYSSNSSLKGLMAADTQTPPLVNYSICREMLPHRFVDVTETVSIIGEFYVCAIRQAAAFSRQALYLTRSFPSLPCMQLALEKLEIFLASLTCGDVNPSSIWSEIGQVAADTVGIDSQSQ